MLSKPDPTYTPPYSKKPEEPPRLPRDPFPWPRPGDIPEPDETPLTPFLVIRVSQDDDGSRPVSSLGGGSPDIVITGPTVTVFTLGSGTAHLVPAPDFDQTIVVRVWNFGSDASVTARIRFWEVSTREGSEPEPELIATAYRGVPGESSALVHCPEIWNPHRYQPRKRHGGCQRYTQ
jgi:hypothetical protein